MNSNQFNYLIKQLHRMQWIIIIILVVISVFTFCGKAKASDWKAETLKFGTGVISAYALHETGHQAAAWVTGENIEWEMGGRDQFLSWTENVKHRGSGLFINSAGLLAQVATSEIILQSDINKNSSFVRGMMAWNVINPIIYSLDYWIFRRANQEDDRHYQGDMQGVEHYSNDATANGYAVAMTGMALWQGWRFLKTQWWAPEWVRSDVARVDFRSVGDGAALTVGVRF